jgi:tRNA-binding protein
MNTLKISWDDFEKVDIRTGTILAVKEFDKARKSAYQLEIDFGPLGIKKSSAQITDLYEAESLIGQQILAVVNFPPKQIANFFSECLVLGVVNPKGTVTLLKTERKTKNGLRIS